MPDTQETTPLPSDSQRQDQPASSIVMNVKTNLKAGGKNTGDSGLPEDAHGCPLCPHPA